MQCPVLPDLDSLRCFEAAAARLNFREAASLVGLSPPAFSQRIRRLEEQLDAKLFERTTRRVVLTAEGLRLRPHARRCIDQAGLCRAVAHAGVSQSYELTVGTDRDLGVQWLMPQLGQLEQAEPTRGLNVFFGKATDLFQHLRRGAVDALILGGKVVTPESATSELLMTERYVFVGAATLLAHRPIVNAGAAARHVLLDVDGESSTFEHFLRASPPNEPWNFLERRSLASAAAVRAEVVAGRGVAVIPRLCVESALSTGALVEIMPERRPRTDWVRMYWTKGHPRSAQLEELAEALRPQPSH